MSFLITMNTWNTLQIWQSYVDQNKKITSLVTVGMKVCDPNV